MSELEGKNQGEIELGKNLICPECGFANLRLVEPDRKGSRAYCSNCGITLVMDGEESG